MSRIALSIMLATAMSALLIVTASLTLQAQDTLPPELLIAEGLPPKLAKRLVSNREELVARGLAGDAETRGIASSLRVWSTVDLKHIRVCFYQPSSPALRQAIKLDAMQWTSTTAHIPLNFGDDPEQLRICKAAGEGSEIRIGFNSSGDYRGRWSLIGSDSVNDPANRAGPSMNLEGFHRIDLSVEAQRTVLRRVVQHEFGHALGLEHEHQSPFAACEQQIDRPAMVALLTKPPMNWQENQINDNMKVLYQRGMIGTDPVDQHSIMFYALDAAIFKTGRQSPCYRPINATISPGDRAMIEALYPKQPAQQKALLDQRRRQFEAALAKKGLGPDNPTRGQLMDRYFQPRP